MKKFIDFLKRVDLVLLIVACIFFLILGVLIIGGFASGVGAVPSILTRLTRGFLMIGIAAAFVYIIILMNKEKNKSLANVEPPKGKREDHSVGGLKNIELDLSPRARSFWKIRREYYRAMNWPYEAKTDEHETIRLEYYRNQGFTEDSFIDDFWKIRFEGYTTLGFRTEAKADPDYHIRIEAYRKFGYTSDALKDEFYLIRQEAATYLESKKDDEIK